MLHPDDPRMPHHLRKAEAEVVLREALGERLTVLRPAAYHQNLLGQARTGMLSVPYSLDAPFTNVDLDDVAQVAADALLGAHAGLTLDLAGPEVLTTRQMTEEAAAALGRPVSDTRITAGAVAVRPGRRARPTRPGNDLAAMFTAYDEGGLVGDPSVLAGLLGRDADGPWATSVCRSAPGRIAAGGEPGERTRPACRARRAYWTASDAHEVAARSLRSWTRRSASNFESRSLVGCIQ